LSGDKTAQRFCERGATTIEDGHISHQTNLVNRRPNRSEASASLWHFLFRARRKASRPTLVQFLGEPQDQEEEALDSRPASHHATRPPEVEAALGKG
jgi:hypothetical protein